jgi:hypothetical protein
MVFNAKTQVCFSKTKILHSILVLIKIFCYTLGYLYADAACLAENWNPGGVVPGDREEVVGDALAPAPPLTCHASRLKGTAA